MNSPSASSVTVLGSGTLVPNAGRSSAAHLIEAPGVRLLLDCGAGTLHGFDRHGVPWQQLTHVAFSHLHTDHVGDLPALLAALKHGVSPRRQEGLTLVGPPGFRDFFTRLSIAMGGQFDGLGFPLLVCEISRERPLGDQDAGFKLEAHPTRHTEESVAYRWEGSDGVVAYTGDTGPCEELARFLSGADVLISECTVPDPTEMETHLSPAGLAELAGVARPGLLVLTHVGPGLTPEEAVRAVGAAGYAGQVVAGFDGLRLPLRA